jgi:hypothetical protein
MKIALFGIAGFAFGFCVFSMLWTVPLKDSPYGRKVVGDPRYWYLAVSAGLATAVVFLVLSRVL